MSPAQSRQLFPLATADAITLAWLPVTVLSAAVDGYFEAFFACLPDWNRQ